MLSAEVRTCSSPDAPVALCVRPCRLTCGSAGSSMPASCHLSEPRLAAMSPSGTFAEDRLVEQLLLSTLGDWPCWDTVSAYTESRWGWMARWAGDKPSQVDLLRHHAPRQTSAIRGLPTEGAGCRDCLKLTKPRSARIQFAEALATTMSVYELLRNGCGGSGQEWGRLASRRNVFQPGLIGANSWQRRLPPRFAVPGLR